MDWKQIRQQFFENLNKLSKADIAYFRQHISRKMNMDGYKKLVKVLPKELYTQKDTAYYIACVHCTQNERRGNQVTFQDYLSSVYNNKNTSQSMKRQIEKLLSTNKNTCYFFYHINQFVQMANKESKLIALPELMEDIQFWEDRKNKYAQTIAEGVISAT